MPSSHQQTPRSPSATPSRHAREDSVAFTRELISSAFSPTRVKVEPGERASSVAPSTPKKEKTLMGPPATPPPSSHGKRRATSSTPSRRSVTPSPSKAVVPYKSPRSRTPSASPSPSQVRSLMKYRTITRPRSVSRAVSSAPSIGTRDREREGSTAREAIDISPPSSPTPSSRSATPYHNGLENPFLERQGPLFPARNFRLSSTYSDSVASEEKVDVTPRPNHRVRRIANPKPAPPLAPLIPPMPALLEQTLDEVAVLLKEQATKLADLTSDEVDDDPEEDKAGNMVSVLVKALLVHQQQERASKIAEELGAGSDIHLSESDILDIFGVLPERLRFLLGAAISEYKNDRTAKMKDLGQRKGKVYEQFKGAILPGTVPKNIDRDVALRVIRSLCRSWSGDNFEDILRTIQRQNRAIKQSDLQDCLDRMADLCRAIVGEIWKESK